MDNDATDAIPVGKGTLGRPVWEMTPEERAAEADTLRSAYAVALNTPLMSEGEISATQVNRMGKKAFARWQANAQRRMLIEARIRDLRLPETDIQSMRCVDEERQREERKRKIGYARERIRMLQRVGTGKRGVRKAYAEEIARIELEIQALEKNT